MKYTKVLSVAVVMVTLLSAVTLVSCKKDFFEIEDPSGIEDAQIWEDEGAIGFFLNRTYALVIPQWPTIGGIHNTSDELNNANTAFLYGQLVENSVTDIGTSTSITANRYADIRRCNVAIEGINGSVSVSDSSKRVLKGQFFFLRAYTYFRLVRLYGGVPLILKTQSPGDEDLQTPRSKTSVCIAAIAADLDSAAAYLPKTWTGVDIGRVTRAAALAVKGKALLYWASPQFNYPTADPARWTAAYAANKAAYDACVADGYSLVANYANIFLTEDNKEVLIVRKYNTSRDLGTNIENITRPYSETTAGSGSNQPTWNLVSAYPMNNGLQPYLANGTTVNPLATNYSDTMFWLNRDPRFYASISYTNDVWPLSGKAGRKQWTYKGVLDEAGSAPVTGFYCKRLCNPSISAAAAVYNSNTGGGSGMDWIEMRYAEVILNLAECATEVSGDLIEAKNYVRMIRQRAGIVAGAYDYGMAVATDRASMRELILYEREVEFAMEGMRNFDLRRTRNLNKITPRLSYILNCKPPYYPGVTRTGALPTDIFLEKSTAGVIPRDTANFNNPAVYTKIFTVPVVKASLEGTNTIVMPDRYYVYPLPNLFTQTPAIQQTLGWAGGTFNPYE